MKPRDDEGLLFDLPLKRQGEGETGEPEKSEPPRREQEQKDSPAGERVEAPTDLPLLTAAAEGSPPRPRPVPRAPAQEPGSTRVSRLLAGLLDLALHAAVLGLAVAAADAMGVRPRAAHVPALVAFLLLFSFLYHLVPLAFWGRTPGMASLGLVARSREDKPLSFAQAARRWLAALITLLSLGLAWLAEPSLADRLSNSSTRRRQEA